MTFLFSEFLPLIFYFGLAAFLAFLIFFISFILSQSNAYSEKLSPYECGFDPFDNARNQFEVRFYLVAILFLIFDLEASFLFPWASNLSVINSFGFWVILDFFFELVIGLIYVWSIGAFNWD